MRWFVLSSLLAAVAFAQEASEPSQPQILRFGSGEKVRAIKPQQFQVELPDIYDPLRSERPKRQVVYLRSPPYFPQPQQQYQQQPQQFQQPQQAQQYQQVQQFQPTGQYLARPAVPQQFQHQQPAPVFRQYVVPQGPQGPQGPQYPRFNLRPAPVRPVRPVYIATTPASRGFYTERPQAAYGDEIVDTTYLNSRLPAPARPAPQTGYSERPPPPAPVTAAPYLERPQPQPRPAPRPAPYIERPIPVVPAPYIEKPVPVQPKPAPVPAPYIEKPVPVRPAPYVEPTTARPQPRPQPPRTRPYVVPTTRRPRPPPPPPPTTTTPAYVEPVTTTTARPTTRRTTTTTTTTTAAPTTTTTRRTTTTTTTAAPTTTTPAPTTTTRRTTTPRPTTTTTEAPTTTTPSYEEAVETPQYDETFVGQYYYGRKGEGGNNTFPLPSCFYNPSGYVCCNLMLNELMTTSFEEVKVKTNLCNVHRFAIKLQKHSEKIFQTQFETIVSYEDFSQKIHFKKDLVCKVEIEGRFILAYATPEDVEQEKIIPTVPSREIQKDSFTLKEEVKQKIKIIERGQEL